MEPTINDVLSGRGAWFNQHPGNERFRQMLDRQIMIVWEVLAHRLWHVKTDLLLMVGQEQAQLMPSLQETMFVLI